MLDDRCAGRSAPTRTKPRNCCLSTAEPNIRRRSAPTPHRSTEPQVPAWLRPKQTDMVPGKGQFRSRFPQSAQLRLSDNDFAGSPQPTPTSSQRNILDGRGGNGWARLLRCGRDRLGGGFPNAPCRVAVRNVWEAMARFAFICVLTRYRYLRFSMSARVARAVLISSDS
jgi:hypothetical protein